MPQPHAWRGATWPHGGPRLHPLAPPSATLRETLQPEYVSAPQRAGRGVAQWPSDRAALFP
eukprot:7121091-Alexandrium_andersonii.AAC.1